MNLLNTHGRTAYGALTLAGFLCALAVGFIAFFSFAIDAPRYSWEPDFYLSRIVLGVIVLATIALFVSLVGVFSRAKTYAVLSIIGSSLLLPILLRYVTNVISLQSKYGDETKSVPEVIFIAFVQTVLLIFSVMKLLQLRGIRVYRAEAKG